jgi:FeS assembly SUF system protein
MLELLFFDKVAFMGYITRERIPTELLGLEASKRSRAMAEINEAEVLDALRECYDPEIPVNIVDLGLIYGIDIDPEAANVHVNMTLTAMGCPMAGEVISEVEMRVGQVENVKSCKVDLTFDPPWSPERMTEDAKWELGMV